MTQYKQIHISTFEEFFKSEDWRRNWIANNRPENEVYAHDKRMSDRDEKRKEYRKRFPFTVILQGAFSEHDFVSRWCWQNIGPKQCEECHESSSEYPGCPLALATEYIKTGWYLTNKNQRVYWSEKAYIEEKVPKHSHEGTWRSMWLGKTGYDYGCGEYYFQNESDRDEFLAAIPIFSLGERYEKDSKMTTLTAEKTVHQSKWGFHPISREASQKLRFINGVYAKAQHLAGAWERWERKRPENRVMKRAIKAPDGVKVGTEIVKDALGNPVFHSEPQVCPLFHETVPGHMKYGGYIRAAALDNGFGDKILFASRQARTPQPTPADVLSFPFTEEEIDALYETAKSWMDNR